MSIIILGTLAKVANSAASLKGLEHSIKQLLQAEDYVIQNISFSANRIIVDALDKRSGRIFGIKELAQHPDQPRDVVAVFGRVKF